MYPLKRYESGVTKSFKLYGSYRLLLYFIQRNSPEFNSGKINFIQVDTPYGTVIHGPVIYNTIGHIRCRGPLGGTGN